MIRWLSNVWFEIKRFIIKDYYLRIKTLGYGYQCGEDIILDGMFQVLIDFVDQESDTIEWMDDDINSAIWVEILFLYKWWTIKRPTRKVVNIDHPKLVSIPITEGLSKGMSKMKFEFRDAEHEKQWHISCGEKYEIEKTWWDEDTEMLKRLIDVRGSLWT